MWRAALVATAVSCAACASERADPEEAGFTRLPQPHPGEWRHLFPEPRQTFADYCMAVGRALEFEKRRIRVLPIGRSVPGDDEIIKHVGELLAAYYMTRVEIEQRINMPDDVAARPTRGYGPQYKAEDVLRSISSDLPANTVARLAVTSSDLYAFSPSGASLNFVFGMGGVGTRSGVVSLARYGVQYLARPARGDLLMRSLKVAAHEVGHIFGLAHCQTYECGMNGSNSLDESDRRPIHLCPECLRKLAWHLDCDVAVRYGVLARVYRRLGLKPEAEFAARREAAARAARTPVGGRQ